MKTTYHLFITALFCFVISNNAQAEKPIQHRIVPDITSAAEAKSVFTDTTEQLLSKKTLDQSELHDIHMITYSLEKAVAYYVDTTQGDKQKAAQKMAEVVELIHLGSENNRKIETEIYLQEYSKLAEAFDKQL